MGHMLQLMGQPLIFHFVEHVYLTLGSYDAFTNLYFGTHQMVEDQWLLFDGVPANKVDNSCDPIKDVEG